MNKSKQAFLSITFSMFAFNSAAAEQSQYNMSLQDKVVTGPKGSLASPQAASANKTVQIAEKSVRKIADGIYLT